MKRTITYLSTTLSALLLAAALAPAQESRLDGPVSGLVYDEQAHAIRAIVGVPGAAYLGASLLADLDFATVSPNGRFALALKEGKLSLLSLSGELTTEAIAENYPTPALSSWTADSDAVAIYGAEAGIALWRSLGSSREAAHLGTPQAKLSTMILEDGARSVVYVADGDASDSVFRAAEGAEPALLFQGLDIPALATANRAVYIADKGNHTVSVARDNGGAVEIAQLANEALGVNDPVGLAVLGDALLVASGANHELIRLNASTGELLGRVALEFAPDRMVRLTMGADGVSPLFSLKGRETAADPFEVLDAARGAVFFVPAADAVSVAVEE